MSSHYLKATAFLLLFCFNLRAENGKFRLSVSSAFLSDSSSGNVTSNYSNLFGGFEDASGILRPKMKSDKRNGSATVVRAGMIYPTSNHFAMGVNLVVQPGASRSVLKTDDYSLPNPNNRPDELRDYSIETTMNSKNHYALEIEGIVRLFQSWEAFLRGGFHKMESDITTATTVDEGSVAGPVSIINPASKKTFYGISFGGGVAYRLTQHIFATGYAQWLRFESQRVDGPGLTSSTDEINLTNSMDITPSETRMEFGLGFQF